jgi:hypothetical protein
MNTKTLTLCLSALYLSACGGDGNDDPPASPEQDEAKVQVRASLDDSDEANDQSCDPAWAGDGVCDSFCPEGDVEDCAIACPAIWSPADGNCDESDPCGPFTDEDCQSPPDDDDPIACTEFWTEADGVCDWTKPCATVQDEDCQEACVPPSSKDVACIAIAYETNGDCEAAAGCEANDPVDCHACLGAQPGEPGESGENDGIACPAVVVPEDGVCPEGDAPCDPDC